MHDIRTDAYARQLAELIQWETVSASDQKDKTKFRGFHDLLRRQFPKLFSMAGF